MDNTQTDYRTVFFGSDAGRRVLGHLLADAGFFDPDLKKPEEQAIQNFMKKRLEILGVTKKDNIVSFVNKLAELKGI